MATNEFLVGSSSKKGKGEDKIEMKGFFFLDRCRLRLVTSLSLVNMYPLDEQKKLFNRFPGNNRGVFSFRHNRYNW